MITHNAFSRVDWSTVKIAHSLRGSNFNANRDRKALENGEKIMEIHIFFVRTNLEMHWRDRYFVRSIWMLSRTFDLSRLQQISSTSSTKQYIPVPGGYSFATNRSHKIEVACTNHLPWNTSARILFTAF